MCIPPWQRRMIGDGDRLGDRSRLLTVAPLTSDVTVCSGTAQLGMRWPAALAERGRSATAHGALELEGRRSPGWSVTIAIRDAHILNMKATMHRLIASLIKRCIAGDYDPVLSSDGRHRDTCSRPHSVSCVSYTLYAGSPSARQT